MKRPTSSFAKYSNHQPGDRPVMNVIEGTGYWGTEAFLTPDAVDLLSNNLPRTAMVAAQHLDNGNFIITVNDETPGQYVYTKWLHDPENRAVEFRGWDCDGGNMRQLAANRFALYTMSGIETVTSQFARVGIYAFLRMGFIPTDEGWDMIRSNTPSNLKIVDSLCPLPAQVKDRVREIISSDNPNSAWDLVDLRQDVSGRPLGYRMMLGNKIWANVDLTDIKQMSRIRDYIGANRYDDSMDMALACALMPGIHSPGNQVRIPMARRLGLI